MDYYFINEIPIFSYIMMGITTLILAVSVVQESNLNNENDENNKSIINSITGGSKNRKHKSK